MTDDIVTRLMHCTDYDCDLLGDAGREIERLRAELASTQIDLQRIEMKYMREIYRGNR